MSEHITISESLHQLAQRAPADGYVSVDLQPTKNGDVAWVDATAAALGLEPKNVEMLSGDWQRQARGWIGRVEVAVLTGISEPADAKRARLLAQLAELDAAEGGDTA